MFEQELQRPHINSAIFSYVFIFPACSPARLACYEMQQEKGDLKTPKEKGYGIA